MTVSTLFKKPDSYSDPESDHNIKFWIWILGKLKINTGEPVTYRSQNIFVFTAVKYLQNLETFQTTILNPVT